MKLYDLNLFRIGKMKQKFNACIKCGKMYRKFGAIKKNHFIRKTGRLSFVNRRSRIDRKLENDPSRDCTAVAGSSLAA